jgi:hypothetical protein
MTTRRKTLAYEKNSIRVFEGVNNFFENLKTLFIGGERRVVRQCSLAPSLQDRFREDFRYRKNYNRNFHPVNNLFQYFGATWVATSNRSTTPTQSVAVVNATR